jgi:hypothetical protein
MHNINMQSRRGRRINAMDISANGIYDLTIEVSLYFTDKKCKIQSQYHRGVCLRIDNDDDDDGTGGGVVVVPSNYVDWSLGVPAAIIHDPARCPQRMTTPE